MIEVLAISMLVGYVSVLDQDAAVVQGAPRGGSFNAP